MMNGVRRRKKVHSETLRYKLRSTSIAGRWIDIPYYLYTVLNQWPIFFNCTVRMVKPRQLKEILSMKNMIFSLDTFF